MHVLVVLTYGVSFKDWEDIVIMITNKEFKPKVIDTNAWDRMEKDLDE